MCVCVLFHVYWNLSIYDSHSGSYIVGLYREVAVLTLFGSGRLASCYMERLLKMTLHLRDVLYCSILLGWLADQ